MARLSSNRLRLAVASLKCSLAGLDDRAPSADLNRRIAAAIAVALDPQSSHSIRVSTSIWLDRMSQMASDTEGMIDELMRLDSLQL